MIRVVNEGSLATRNGRLILEDYTETDKTYFAWKKKRQICFDEDI